MKQLPSFTSDFIPFKTRDNPKTEHSFGGKESFNNSFWSVHVHCLGTETDSSALVSEKSFFSLQHLLSTKKFFLFSWLIALVC
jgi:hypothetical protein